jgi:uncharacterized protein
MAGASMGYHEAEEKLSTETKNAHKALVSLQEELEAIDWYRQRADAAENEALKAVLLHNMGEEIEHACMLMEWLRRHLPLFDKNMRVYLFKEQPITEIEKAEEQAQAQPSARRQPGLNGLTIGSMKGD